MYRGYRAVPCSDAALRFWFFEISFKHNLIISLEARLHIRRRAVAEAWRARERAARPDKELGWKKSARRRKTHFEAEPEVVPEVPEARPRKQHHRAS